MKTRLTIRALGAAAAAAALFTLTACGGGSSDTGDSSGDTGGDSGGSSEASGTRGDNLSLGIVGDVTSWDPSQAHVGHYLQPYQAAYDTLLYRTPDGELEPMLATEWSYNDDNTVLTLELRDDVTFSDGAAFNADAVKANMDAFKVANGRQATQLNSLDEVVVVDEDTVEVHLTAPDPAMTYYLSQAAGLMGSPESLGSDAIASTPVGSGPYVMDTGSSQAGSVYVFTAREGYWNPDMQKWNRIEMRVLTDVTARLNALLSGQVDATSLDVKTGPQAVSQGKTEYLEVDGWNGLLLIDRDGEVNPAMADVRVRQALNYAFDRETMFTEVNASNGEVTNQVFGTTSGAFIEELESRYPYDPDMAKQLLAEAGYGDGLTLTMPAMPGLESTYAVVTQQLADVGITLQTEAITSQEVYTSITDKKYPMVWFQLFQGEAWVNINQWISTSATQFNPYGSTTPELQEMIDEVQVAGDEAGEKAKAVNEYVTEEAWFVPWYRVNSLYYADPSVDVVTQTQQAVPSIYNFTPAS